MMNNKFARNMVLAVVLSLLFFVACGHQSSTMRKYNKKAVHPNSAGKKRIPSRSNKRKKTDELPKKEITITMNFQDAKLYDVLKVIAKEFKVNLVAPNDNTSRVTVYLYKANLKEALDMILSSLDYSYFEKGQTYLILKNSETVSRVYRLKYANALEVEQVIRGMSEKAHIKADRSTNSVVITDVLGNMKAYDEIIQSLDSFQPSVMIEAELLEVSLNDSKNLGLEWDMDFYQSPHQLNVQSPAASSATSLFLNYTNLKAPQVQLILNALRKSAETHLLSSPRIVTLNGQEAKILVGERVPYVRASTATSIGSVLQEVEFVDVGILLKVTPRILEEENLIFIDVQPEVSEVMDMEVQGVPRIGTREAHTRVAVKDGETIVIAGLIKNNKVKSNSSLPLLGRIPLLKWLFGNSNNTQSRRELIVFITPHIITKKFYDELGSKKNTIKRKMKLDENSPLFDK